MGQWRFDCCSEARKQDKEQRFGVDHLQGFLKNCFSVEKERKFVSILSENRAATLRQHHQRTMNRFRVMDSDSEDSDSPPLPSGNGRTPRKLVIDDPSSDDESSFTTAREDDEEEELDVPFEGLALTSPANASPALNSKAVFEDSPSTLSMIEKLQAGGVPHVVRTQNRGSGVSSLEPPHDGDDGHPYHSDNESNLETPQKVEPFLDNEDNSEALVDNLSVEQDDDNDSKSTVVQEGRTKTPKRHVASVDNDNNSDALLDNSLEQDDASTALYENHVKTPSVQDTVAVDDDSEALVDSSPDDSSTVLQEGRIKTPMRQPSENEIDSEGLLESSMEDDDEVETIYPAETPARERTLDDSRMSEALVDTSVEQDDTCTVLQVEKPIRESSYGNNSEALLDSTSDEDDSLGIASEALVDATSPSSTVLQVSASEATLNNRRVLDLSLDNDDASTLYPAETPTLDSSIATKTPNKTTDHNDSPTTTLHEEVDASSDLESLVRGFSDKVIVSNAIPVKTVDSSSEEEDSITDDKNHVKISSDKLSRSSNAHDLSDTSSAEDDTSTVVQEGRVKTPKRPFLLDNDSSDESLSDISVEEEERKVASFEDAFEDCAWALDSSTNEVYLSDEKFEAPNDTVWPKFRLPRELYERLYCHQKIGVQWMAGLHSIRIGGICGDDMVRTGCATKFANAIHIALTGSVCVRDL